MALTISNSKFHCHSHLVFVSVDTKISSSTGESALAASESNLKSVAGTALQTVSEGMPC
eukprot:CAMPEP_0194737818 /NCGR_PEP_ID=MMETSP0296-20130528/82555_1 /TAXON_ID=39354 /ORGANISM="Heterosigma akashiwo, Strain CCMP2393" /LENGTH=58 /DNA_ID=CAMNT_0039647897 /DNA_START=19 /DNA_END=195 /DNA_ORIENTATION=+